MTHSHSHQLFIAHVREPDGNVVDCIIGSEQGAPEVEVRERFERFLQETQAPGHVVIGFHRMEEEPVAPQMPTLSYPSALSAMILKGYALVMTILAIIRYLYRRSN